MPLTPLWRRFAVPVFCTLLVCFCSGVQPFPVVYPSLTRTTGFAFINDTEELVTIPAALGHLLCSTPGESVDFEPADKPCSEIAFFTSSSFLTFEVLNVSSNGVIQPITTTPQVATSNDGVQLSWRIPSRDTDESEEITRGASSSVTDPTSSQTNSPNAVLSSANETRSENSDSATPSRFASPSPEPLPSSPSLTNETVEAGRNETGASDPSTRSVPISDSDRNTTTTPEGSANEDTSVSPSPQRLAPNTNETNVTEAEFESTISPPSAQSPSSSDAPVEAPTETSILAETMVLAPASSEAETNLVASPTERSEASQSEPALIPTSAESVIIPESTESLTSPESRGFASIPSSSESSPRPRVESASAPASESGPFEAGTSRAQFALALIPESSSEDTVVPFLESFLGLEPAVDRFINTEIFAQGSEPPMDRSEESEQYDAEALSPSESLLNQRSTNDTDRDYLIDDEDDGNTSARQSRRERRRQERLASSNDTTVDSDPDDFYGSIADASLESEAEVEEAEEGEERSLRRLMQDLPPATDAAVLEANETSGFLDPNGAVRDDVNFVLQLEARSLPEQTLFTLEFSFGDGVTRAITLYFDPSPVSADIEESPNPNDDPNRRIDEYVYRVRFSSRMVSLPDEESMSCPSVTEPLNALSSAQFDPTQNSLTPYDLTALIRSLDGQSSCSQRLEQLDPTSIVNVDEAGAVVEVEDEPIDIDELRNGSRPAGSVVTVNFSSERDRKKRVTFNVGSDRGVSLSGVPVNQAARQYRVGLGSSKIRDAKDVGEIIGITATAFMGTAIGISFVLTVGTPCLSLFKQGIVDPVGSPSPLSSAVDLLQLGQRTYLMTKLAVPNLPENFIAYGEQLHWTMLNFDLPWKEDSADDDDTEHIKFDSRKLLNITQEEEEEESKGDPRSENGSGKDGEHESLYKDLRQAYFWLALSFVGVIFLHLFLLALFLANGKEVPGTLRLPRLEIYLFQATIAVLAGGPANLFAGTTTQIIVGFVVACICIFPLSFWQVHILQKYVLSEERTERNIVYVLKPDDDTTSTDNSRDQPSPNPESVGQVVKEKIDDEVPSSWFEKYVCAFFFGQRYRSGVWKEKDKKAKRVVSRFGPIFEDSRGEPMIEQESVEDEGSNQPMQRITQFVPVKKEHRYPVDVPRHSFCSRTSEKLINLGKSVFVACLIMGEDHAERDYQAFLILIALCSYVVYLRVFRPHTLRWKLALALAAASLEVVLYVLVVALIYIGESSETELRIDVGKAMLVVTNLSKALLLLDVAMSCIEMFKQLLETIYADSNEVTTQEETSDSEEKPFEEEFWKNPRGAINSKIVQPLVESVRNRASGRGRRGGYGGPSTGPSTEHNPPSES